jgi:hypothetical protein
MAAENLKSTSITNLDSTPAIANTRGSGASAYTYNVDDTVAATAAGLAATASTYRMCRIPVEAKIKSLSLAVSTGLDTNASPTLVFDLNLAFSDSTTDGTPQTVTGQIPTSANTGATTTVGTYSSPNLLFGQTTGTQAKTTFVKTATSLTFNGVGSNYAITFPQTELWSLFGFTNPYSVALDCGGFFDLLLYTSTGAATGVAGTIYAKIEFVV